MKHLKELVNALAEATDLGLAWIWALVRLPARAFRRKPGPIVQKPSEAERLDRIRNPSKYWGK